MARLNLQIEMEHKRGIDKGLVISSELHSIEEINEGGKVVITMKSGLSMEFSAQYKDNQFMGPNSIIEMTGLVKDIPRGYSGPTSFRLEGSLGATVATSLDGKDGQLVDIRITPRSR